jgi:hypothetical protein
MSNSRAEDEAAIQAVLVDSYKGDAAIVISESAILFAGETEVPDDSRKVKRRGCWRSGTAGG